MSDKIGVSRGHASPCISSKLTRYHEASLGTLGRCLQQPSLAIPSTRRTNMLKLQRQLCPVSDSCKLDDMIRFRRDRLRSYQSRTQNLEKCLELSARSSMRKEGITCMQNSYLHIRSVERFTLYHVVHLFHSHQLLQR